MTDQEPSHGLRLVTRPELDAQARQQELISCLEHLLVDARAGYLSDYCVILKDTRQDQLRFHHSNITGMNSLLHLLGMISLFTHHLGRLVFPTTPPGAPPG